MASNSQILPLTGSDTPSKSEEKIFKGSPMTKRGAYAAISYMTCAGLSSFLFVFFPNFSNNSPNQCPITCVLIVTIFAVLLVLFNKAALSSYNFPCANVITLCQVGGFSQTFFFSSSVSRLGIKKFQSFYSFCC